MPGSNLLTEIFPLHHGSEILLLVSHLREPVEIHGKPIIAPQISDFQELPHPCSPLVMEWTKSTDIMELIAIKRDQTLFFDSLPLLNRHLHLGYIQLSFEHQWLEIVWEWSKIICHLLKKNPNFINDFRLFRLGVRNHCLINSVFLHNPFRQLIHDF